MNNPSYYPNYYSIDDIMVTQERIPCRALRSLEKLGKFVFCSLQVLPVKMELKLLLCRLPGLVRKVGRFGEQPAAGASSVVPLAAG